MAISWDFFFFFLCGESIFGLLGVCVVSFILRFPPKAISCGLLLLLLCGESVFVDVACLCACLCFDLDISFIFFALNPLKRFRLDFFFFCARESVLVYFWCLRRFILFSSLFPP